MTAKEYREKRASLVDQARKILDKADAEKRNRTAEEIAQYEAIDKDIDVCEKDIRDADKQEARERELATSQGTIVPRGNPGGDTGEGGEARTGPRSTPEYRAAFDRYLRVGKAELNEVERRALSVGTDTAGGYLTAPQAAVDYILKKRDDLVFMRGLATKKTVAQAQSLGIPTIETDPSDAEWTSEIGTGSDDSAMAFGKRELWPRPLAKRIKVSNKLLRLAPVAEPEVLDRLAYKFRVSEEKAYLTGTGANQPLGVFTLSADGIPASRDVATGNTATSIGADGLVEAKYSIKAAYWPNLRWIFSRAAVKQIRLLKDGEVQYLWRPGIAAGQPDTIEDAPFLMSEYAPAVFTANQYVGIIGDFSFYQIADALTMEIQRLVELYAETNQTGFIGRLETDGMPVLAEAFARVKLGA